MAVLPDNERRQVWGDFMRDLSAKNVSVGTLTKADLRAAVDAIDSWIDSNAASFNSAIPLPARTELTARQKAWLLTYVVRRRFEVS